MPTQAIHSALLVLGNSEGLPWTTPSWQALTKVHGLPWDTTDNAPDDARSMIVPEWNVRVAKEVKVFVQKVLSMPEAEQDDYIIAGKGDNNSAGRKAWKDWVRARLPKWSINRAIDETLRAEGRGPYQVMAERGTRKVSCFVPGPSARSLTVLYIQLPTLEEAQLSDMRSIVANRLLGDKVFVGSGTLLKTPVLKFVDTLLAITWNRYRKSTSREVDRLEKDLEEIAMVRQGA